ncbi:MAG: DUF4189 domain-containing protein [Weeksellaceae bacterium]|nr:DUF4189 domain-containing protein [Bacteroidota bacterium]MCG2780322.1 DUF4189 domain-containing protein [Weeksellaceae bacterium]
MKKSLLVLTLIAVSFSLYAQKKQPLKKPAAAAKTAASKYGALAIDRSNGFYYGWSFDYPTLAEAEKKAAEECIAKGGNCTVVLSYSGAGCAAYRTVDGSQGTAYGWGLAKTKEEADAIAAKECLKRSGGVTPANFVWSCNSAGTGILKEIYNASDEIEAPVTVGTQTWSNRNLDVTAFRNGDPIPEAKNAAEWQEFCKNNKPAYCYKNFDPANGKKLGKLYNFHAVTDSRGLAPKGWHVPSKGEYETLIAFLGGKYEAGKKLRAKTGWDQADKNGFAYGNGSNSSGLNFLASGQAWENEYDGPNPPVSSVFKGNNSQGQWWSSTIDGSSRWNDNGGQYGYYNNGFTLYFGTNNYTGLGSEAPQRGFSVRLIRD